jgi:hypothetical protein
MLPRSKSAPRYGGTGTWSSGGIQPVGGGHIWPLVEFGGLFFEFYSKNVRISYESRMNVFYRNQFGFKRKNT